ncbi:hypothetical protein TNCV_4557111 [Trichonephila clavipes]|nr:hypothetical protein TNCV_4557111 [Trichonephila clavipes]
MCISPTSVGPVLESATLRPHQLVIIITRLPLLQDNFFSQSLDSPGWALAFSRSLLHASVLQFLVLITRQSFSRPSTHLRSGLPFLRGPIGWVLETSLVVRFSSILTTGPSYLIRCILTKTMSDSLYE